MGSIDAPHADAFPIRRCMNMSNALEAPNEGDWSYRIELPHLARIAEAGFDAIRLPVRFSNHFEDGAIAPELLERVDTVIRAALDEGLTVILDLHHYEPLMEDPEAHADEFVAIWTALAEHYEGWPDALLFELLNEPTANMDTAMALSLYDRAVPIIRERHPDRWIIYGGAKWNSLDEMKRLPLPTDGRIAHTFHYYDPYEFTHAGVPWSENAPKRPPEPIDDGDRRKLERDMDRAAAQAAPVLLGEFGVYREATDLDARAAWVREIREAAEANGLAWCAWGFAAQFRAFDPEAGEWIPEMRDALLGG